MAAVAVVIVRLYFGAVGLVWIVDGVVESEDLRVVGAVVIIEVVDS